jgi:hypothetical protein
MASMKTLLKSTTLRCLPALLVILLLFSACRKTQSPAAAPDPLSWLGNAALIDLLLEDEFVRSPELSRATVYSLGLYMADSLTELSGRLRLLYSNQTSRTLERLSFFLFPNLVGGRLEVTGLRAGAQSIDPRYSQKKSWLLVELPQPLAPGERIELTLEYTLNVPEDSREGYGGLSFTDGVLSLAHAYPTLPAVPDEDLALPPEYGDFLYNPASFYLVSVSMPADVKLAFPGKELGNTVRQGRRTLDFVMGPARDLYLAASRGFEARTLDAGPVRITSYAQPGENLASAATQETARKALEAFGRRFGSYPFSTLAIVSVPVGAFGIEYPGIIVNSSRMYDTSWSYQGIPAAALLETTTVHEVAHQWFYSLVGNDQRGEPWLDEAPAQYATWLYYRDRYGEGSARSYYDSFELRWQRVELQPIPIGLPLDAYTEVEYGAIVYGRGPLFLAALEERMGEEAFARFMRAYLDRFRWRVANGIDFQKLAEETCGCSLGDLFTAWVYP